MLATVIEQPHDTRPRRRLRRTLLTLAAIAAPLLFFGCASIVTPPPHVVDPTSIFILREAMHVGLVLPDGHYPQQRYVEFGYGDWGYYALGHDAWYHTIPTVLWSTTATLSRREFRADGPARLRQVAAWAELDELRVERAAVDKLRARLEAEFARKVKQRVDQPRLRMSFVPTDSGYWFLNTCADQAAVWLIELGCSVTWTPIRGSLRTPQPAPE